MESFKADSKDLLEADRGWRKQYRKDRLQASAVRKSNTMAYFRKVMALYDFVHSNPVEHQEEVIPAKQAA